MKKIRKIIGLVFITLLVAGCGGGDDDDNVIAGEDADNNGVWDYLDSYIETTYPGQENENTRKVLVQYAVAQQNFLLAETKEEAIAQARIRTNASACVRCVRDSLGDAIAVKDEFRKTQLNTHARVKRYFENDLKLSGEFFDSPNDDCAVCDFGLNK
ncbi:MAG: hypothetical protein WCV72_04305 [Patescibacteria group bacterium]